MQPILAHHHRNPEPVIGEYVSAAFLLSAAMHAMATPSANRGFVAPEAQGHESPGLCKALESLDGDEAVNGLQLGLQSGCNLELSARRATVRLHFKNDRDHGVTCRATSRVALTSSSQVRSSRRMKRWDWANSKLARPSASALSVSR
jgi:hypothetical protein